MNRHIQHLRSSDYGKVPSATFMDYGELALNFNSESLALYTKNNTDSIVNLLNEGRIGSNYEVTSYPSGFKSTSAVSINDKYDVAFKKIENTISSLANNVINDEKVISKTFYRLNASSGFDLKGYFKPSNNNSFSAATTIKEALETLDEKIDVFAETAGSVNDVKIDNVSVITDKVANIPLATQDNSGVMSREDKIKLDNLYRTPNLTLIGSPSFTEGNLSNFDSNNYAQFPFLVDLRGKNYEIGVCFVTDADVTTQQNIFDSEYGLAFAIRNGRLVIAKSTDGVSWAGEHIGTTNINARTTYYVKIKNDGVYVSTNNVDFNKDITADLNNPYPKVIFIGKSNDNTYPFKGTINLNYCYVRINDEDFWMGMDEVGLATRLAIDMSNIDAAGEQKVIDIMRPIIEENEEIVAKAISQLNSSAGFNENGKFIPANESSFSEETTIKGALEVLDNKINNISNNAGDNIDLSNYSLTSHTHSNYSLTSHTHSEYSLTSHTHNDYSLANHTHSDYSLTSHTHNDSYYTKTEVDNHINSALTNYNLIEVITSFDSVSSPTPNKIYLLPLAASSSGANNVYGEYVYVNSNWEKIGEIVVNTDLGDLAGAVINVERDGNRIKVTKPNDGTTYIDLNMVGYGQNSYSSSTPYTSSAITSNDTVFGAIDKVEKVVVSLVEQVLKNKENISTALNSMVYQKNTSAHYINNAESLADADNKLDAAIDALNTRVNGIKTGSTYINYTESINTTSSASTLVNQYVEGTKKYTNHYYLGGEDGGLSVSAISNDANNPNSQNLKQIHNLSWTKDGQTSETHICGNESSNCNFNGNGFELVLKNLNTKGVFALKNTGAYVKTGSSTDTLTPTDGDLVLTKKDLANLFTYDSNTQTLTINNIF